MNFFLKETDDKLFMLYFFLAKLFGVSTTLLIFYPIFITAFQEGAGVSILLFFLIVYIIIAIFLAVFSIIGNQMVYNFLKLTFVDNDFTANVSKRYFLTICSKISLINSILILAVSFSVFFITLDIESILNFQMYYGQVIGNVVVLIGYVFIGLLLNKILKDNRFLQYVTYSILPYTVLMFITNILPNYIW